MKQTKFNSFFREKINKKNRKNLKNKTFTLLCNNCNGGFLYHDLGLQFQSPFINLWIKPNDFIKYLKNIPHYQKQSLNFIKEDDISYPVALLDDIKIYFMHYENEEIAEKKWIERSKRINLDNLYILFLDVESCTYENLLEFEALSFKNKIFFTNKKHYNLKSEFFIKGMENKLPIDHTYKFINKFSGKKFYDQFDYVKWFNNEL